MIIGFTAWILWRDGPYTRTAPVEGTYIKGSPSMVSSEENLA